MEELAKRQCVDGAPLAAPADRDRMLAALGAGWVVDGDKLVKTFRFPDFVTALAFVNQAGAVAEEVNHHPDLHLGWGRVTVETWTHSAGGLTENDFILAARIERASRG